MVYILIYIIENKKETVILNNMDDLTSIIAKIEGIGKPKKITLYEAEQINYKFTLEDKSKTINIKVPKVEIIK